MDFFQGFIFLVWVEFHCLGGKPLHVPPPPPKRDAQDIVIFSGRVRQGARGRQKRIHPTQRFPGMLFTDPPPPKSWGPRKGLQWTFCPSVRSCFSRSHINLREGRCSSQGLFVGPSPLRFLRFYEVAAAGKVKPRVVSDRGNDCCDGRSQTKKINFY